MKRFLDGMDQESSKTQGGKGQIRKIQKKQEGRNGGKKKKRFFLYITPYMEVPILMCSPSVGNTHSGYCPRATLPLENALVWEPPLQYNMVKLMGYLKTLED